MGLYQARRESRVMVTVDTSTLAILYKRYPQALSWDSRIRSVLGLAVEEEHRGVKRFWKRPTRTTTTVSIRRTTAEELFDRYRGVLMERGLRVTYARVLRLALAQRVIKSPAELRAELRSRGEREAEQALDKSHT